ncbi:MAG: carbohydrate-binding module family 20 domain-containing protein [Cellulomonas sp.]
MLACLALAGGLGQGISAAPTAAATPPGSKDVTATLFQWSFASVAKACTDTLGPKGYGYVEVSPAQEHIQGSQWWTSYQPVSYKIAGRLGDEAAFSAMVATCHSAGVKVVADAVINHMTAGSGTGTGGTSYSKYTYPGFYQDQDFHSCRVAITNYGDRTNVQTCELVGMADLNTGSGFVQSTIAAYLNHLLALGVDGFRVDGAKHIAASDLAAIKAKLTNPAVYWVQEVIYGAGEPVQPTEYTATGDLDEFRAAVDLKRIFTSDRLASLSTWGQSWGYLPGNQARVFVDNWDTERNGSTLNSTYGSTYTLANVFMLAWPYGSPNVYSGYAFSGFDAGPPAGGNVSACYTDGWTCQHAWRPVANMVGFRNAVAGAGVTNWWSNGNNAIAFGRGNAGFVVLNHETGALTQTFQTSLPAGSYCDVAHGDPGANGACTGSTYSVGATGTFTATVPAGESVALYSGASGGGTVDPQPTGTSFAVTATTVLGQNISVVGDLAALGTWDAARALALSPATYPTWKLAVALPAGTAFQYKYVRTDASGAVTWESGVNRTATVPSNGTLTLTDTWRS